MSDNILFLVVWIENFPMSEQIHLRLSFSATDAAAVLTATGLEIEKVETVEDIPGGLKGLVVGKITDCEQHPNADRLRVCKVDVGDETLNIVCGAPNAAKGLNVIVAKPGTWIYPISGKPIKIKYLISKMYIKHIF